MSIHSDHPFMLPREQRNPVRRLRGLMPSPVTIWTSTDGPEREGWTISSLLVADGEPAEMIALVDEDSDWWEMFRKTERATVNVLKQGQGWLSDVFARVAPSPGGPFRTGEWADDDWGPRVADAAAWARVRLLDTNPGHAGWGLLVRVAIESVEFTSDDVGALGHLRGRYT